MFGHDPMSSERPSPEIAAMLAAEHDFVVQTRGFIDEVPKRSGPVVAEAVVAFERAMAGPGLIGAAFHQNFSMALRVCGKNELADEWQISALEVFSQCPPLKWRASLLAHAVADSCFQTERFIQAEAWAGRSISEALLVSIDCAWMADTWRIYAQALSVDNMGPEVERRLREAVRLWKAVKGPDPRRSMYAFVGLAMHLRQLGRFPESEAAFEEAIEFSSKFPPQARAFHDTAVEQLKRYRQQN
jgi:tetratricopeptide (TPR) repeat protein